MKQQIILSFISILFLCTSCEKLVLGPSPVNEPIANFEMFWKNIDEHSAIIFSKNINWDSVYQVYRPQIREQTSDDELWQIFIEMIEAFDDEHTAIFDDLNEKDYTSGAHRIEDAIASFSKTLIREQYLEDFEEFDPEQVAPDLSFGKIKNKDVGYIYLGDTDGASPRVLMDTIFASIGHHAAIIFDIRNNGGGRGEFAQGVTDGFAEATRLAFTAQTRNGANYSDFDEKTEFYTTSDGVNQFVKPVIVLTDAFSVSGAEHITTYLKVNSHVTHIGDRTAGAFSSLSNRRFLPNGWSFRYPIQMALSPDGNFLDGNGIVPDVYSKNTPTDIQNGTDRVLEDALDYLLATYGI